jgi:hypothetical protein
MQDNIHRHHWQNRTDSRFTSFVFRTKLLIQKIFPRTAILNPRKILYDLIFMYGPRACRLVRNNIQDHHKLPICYIIIITGRTTLLAPQASLENSARFVHSWELDDPVFISLDFPTIIFYRARSSTLRLTPNLQDQVPVFMSPSERVAQLYPQALGSLFLPFCDSQGNGGGIVTSLHAERG